MVAFIKIYNFLVQTFFILSHLGNRYTMRSLFSVTIFGYHINYLSPKMISNETSLNYKVLDLNENYNFHTKFIFI
jgi:hypothetical protein